MKTRLGALRNQAGVAMMTVILVAAALTAVATASSMIAIQGLRSSADDWRGTRAQSYAEAGLQRFLNDLKVGSVGINAVVTAGCATAPVTIPPGVVGNGTYAAQLTAYNPNTTPQVPPSPWTVANVSSPPCLGRSASTKVPQLYAITSTGSTGAAASPTPGTEGVGRRVIRGVVTISGSGLPVGVYVRNVDANGNPDFNNISLFARGDVVGREKLAFTGNDLYYTLGDVYPGQSTTTPIPAAAHATGAIYGTVNTKKGVEHPPNPNCNANPRGTTGQSLWDGSVTGGTVSSGCSGQSGYPPTSRFTSADLDRITGRSTLPQLSALEYSSLKSTAQSSGIYCAMATGGATGTCTFQGASWPFPGTFQTGNLTYNGVELKNFVAYFEFPSGTNPLSNDLKWNASVGPCSTDPALNKAGVVVVRNGSVTLRGGGSMYGSVIAPEGYVDSAGNYTVTGSVIANQLRLRGTSAFKLDACSVANTPSTLMNVSAGRWSEVDR